MTCRERLRKEHPGYLSETLPGGCMGCPSTYGYMDDPSYCESSSAHCYTCWDREIPEGKNPIDESKHMTLCDRCHCSGICKYSDELTRGLHAIENNLPFITIDVKCEYFNLR